MEETKKCPACAEEIKAEAKKCRYCGEELEKIKTNFDKSIDSFKNYIGTKQNCTISNINYDLKQVHIIYTYKQSNSLIFLILLLFFIIPAFLYAIFCQETHHDNFIVTFNENGDITRVSNKKYKYIMSNFNKYHKDS